MDQDARKQAGAYYTPSAAAEVLVRWAVKGERDRLLDPSCGDGAFVSLHKRSVGVEQDEQEARIARVRAPWALIHKGDFFSWAGRTKERFECAAGNPPFIRYQRFSGDVRSDALSLCRTLGADFSGLASSWAPFLVAVASLLKPGGRMAFVIPAEIGHAPYARPLLAFLAQHFSDVRLLAIKERVFAALSEDVWFLYADGYGGSTDYFTLKEVNRYSSTEPVPESGTRVTLSALSDWNWRLRPFLLSPEVREFYREVVGTNTTTRLADVARIGIGYVSGANDFFHLRPSQACTLRIPDALLMPTVRNARALPKGAVTRATVKRWIAADEPVLLLRLKPGDRLPLSVRRYLDSPEAEQAKSTYKCRNRSPWYCVPDVTVPHAFLSYMSSEGPALVQNLSHATCTNSLHLVELRKGARMSDLAAVWRSPFTRLSAEIEGHPLGGGMLKVEPREAQQIALVSRIRWSPRERQLLLDGIHTLRGWRHLSG